MNAFRELETLTDLNNELDRADTLKELFRIGHDYANRRQYRRNIEKLTYFLEYIDANPHSTVVDFEDVIVKTIAELTELYLISITKD